MKKILWVLILIVILLGVLIIVDRSKPKSVNEGPIKIGVIAPMTGKGAIWGETVSNGIQLALEEINADGGVLGHD